MVDGNLIVGLREGATVAPRVLIDEKGCLYLVSDAGPTRKQGSGWATSA